MDYLQFVLMFMGAASILCMVILGMMFLWEFVTDTLRTLKWQHKYKHRFDKPPTAQCYCKDCKYYVVYDEHRARCGRGHVDKYWNISESWFCWQAEPLKDDPEDERTK